MSAQEWVGKNAPSPLSRNATAISGCLVHGGSTEDATEASIMDEESDSDAPCELQSSMRNQVVQSNASCVRQQIYRMLEMHCLYVTECQVGRSGPLANSRIPDRLL